MVNRYTHNLCNHQNGQYNQLQLRTYEYSGTAYDPVLEVTYTVPAPTVTSTYTYDASGQRVKVVSGGVTTIYPTKSYNVDSMGKKIKHIMAGNGMVATIETSGVTTTPHYISTDHLTGSNVVSSVTGTLEELMDYYPFGSIRLDEKSGAFNEQRKFIGQEYDVDTGLNYLNARYYNSNIGRFISQDPLAIESLQTTDAKKFVAIISNPQNWNTYSYALNNPLVAVDPTGLYTIIVPGTWNSQEAWNNSDAGKSFQASVSNTFNETRKTEVFQWSGDDNDFARMGAAQGIVNSIKNYQFAEGEKLNIVGHSHGGNIGILVSQMIDRKIDNLVTLGTPVRSDYQPNYDMIGRHVNVYSSLDLGQKFAGGQFSATGLLGRLFGKTGASIGDALSWGEFGLAGRKFNGAENINVTIPSFNINPIRLHANLWRDAGVWTKVETRLNAIK